MVPEYKKVPIVTQILYGVGEIPITLTMGLVGTFVLFFYNSVMHLPAALAGVGLSAGLVVDAFVDPYVGYRSDRSRHPFGRRHVFMLAGSVAAGPCFWLMMSPPRGLTTTGLFVWLLVSSIAFRLFMAGYRIPYLSLGAELTSDYDERTRVIAIRSLLGLGGLLAGAALPFLLFFPATADGSDPKLAYEGYSRMGVFFGFLMAVCGLIAIAGTWSRRSFGDDGRRHTAFLASLAEFLHNPNYRALWLSFALAMLSLVLNFSLSVHFLKWYARISDNAALSAIQACLYGGASAGVVSWIWISRRGEKRKMFLVSTLGLAATLCSASLLVGEGHLFGTGNPLPLIAGNLIAGLFASAFWVLPFSMMADVVDEDQLRSVSRREGAAFGILNFGEKVAAGGALLIGGLILTYVVRLEPGAEIQDPDVALRIGLCYGLAPGIILACAGLLTLSYKLTRRRVVEIQKELVSRGGNESAGRGELHDAQAVGLSEDRINRGSGEV